MQPCTIGFRCWASIHSWFFMPISLRWSFLNCHIHFRVWGSFFGGKRTVRNITITLKVSLALLRAWKEVVATTLRWRLFVFVFTSTKFVPLTILPLLLHRNSLLLYFLPREHSTFHIIVCFPGKWEAAWCLALYENTRKFGGHRTVNDAEPSLLLSDVTYPSSIGLRIGH